MWGGEGEEDEEERKLGQEGDCVGGTRMRDKMRRRRMNMNKWSVWERENGGRGKIKKMRRHRVDEGEILEMGRKSLRDEEEGTCMV